MGVFGVRNKYVESFALHSIYTRRADRAVSTRNLTSQILHVFHVFASFLTLVLFSKHVFNYCEAISGVREARLVSLDSKFVCLPPCQKIFDKY